MWLQTTSHLITHTMLRTNWVNAERKVHDYLPRVACHSTRPKKCGRKIWHTAASSGQGGILVQHSITKSILQRMLCSSAQWSHVHALFNACSVAGAQWSHLHVFTRQICFNRYLCRYNGALTSRVWHAFRPDIHNMWEEINSSRTVFRSCTKVSCKCQKLATTSHCYC